jgi:hypothetical protein
MMEPKYTVKEKAFVAFGWIPKATVQAALGGVTIAEAKKTGDPVMIKNGKEMLTMAVFAICITAPLGAILIATLGKRWLAYDAEFDTTLGKDTDVVPVKEDKDATVELAGNAVQTDANLNNDADTNKNADADIEINKVVPQ